MYLWMEEGNFETVVPPVRWGNKIAVTVRRTAPVANGTGTMVKITDLRVYQDTGKLLATLGKEDRIALDDTVPPRVAGDLPFVSATRDAAMREIVALRLR